MSSQTMTLCNPINYIISQAITSAVDGVLAKHQHKHRELLRDFTKTTASVFIQQQKRRTTQIFEEDEEDDVISNNLSAKTNQNQNQLHELEDPHDQVRDFVGASIYDDYDDDFCREPCHNLDVKTKEGDTSPQRKFLSPIDIHEINDDMTRETILTCDVEGCYLTDEPIYDVSDAEVFIDSHYYMDPLFNDDDDIQGDNNRCDVHVVVDEGYICGSREHMNHGLGEKDGHRQFHHEPPDRGWHKEHTYYLVATHKKLTNGPTYTKLSDETWHILKPEHDQEDYLSKLSLIGKHALENKITYLQEALVLEKEKNRNLEYILNETHKKFRMLNKGSASLDKILSMGRT
ncbi:LOW QUALITY PROTEIN: hypothetical protein YC2023_016780 [Brassica napus]